MTVAMFDGPAWIEARNRLVVENLAWAHKIAAKVAAGLPTWFLPEDLQGAAEIALIQRAEEYRGYQGVPFRAFAIQRVRGACFDFCRRKEYRERSHETLSPSGEDRGPEPADPAPNPERLAELSEMRQVWQHLAGLPKRHAAIVVLMYGADLSGKDVAERLNLSEGRVSVLHAEALQMIRDAQRVRPQWKGSVLPDHGKAI